jgi:hypothetical protein
LLGFFCKIGWTHVKWCNVDNGMLLRQHIVCCVLWSPMKTEFTFYLSVILVQESGTIYISKARKYWKWFAAGIACCKEELWSSFFHGGPDIGMLEYLDYQKCKDFQWWKAYLCKVEGLFCSWHLSPAISHQGQI